MSLATAISEFLVAQGVTHVFTVTGGYAQFLNQAFGAHPKLTCVYTQSEAGAAYAAIAFTRQTGRPSVVCTTAGCAATNAVTGVLDAFQDSVPIFFISGQVNTCEIKPKRRHYMGAWAPITELVKSITKFASEPRSLDDAFEAMPHAWNACVGGRPGPVWLSIPLDVQRAKTDNTISLTPAASAPHVALLPRSELQRAVTDALRSAKRPLVMIGGGARHAGIRALVDRLGVPCIFTFMSLDIIQSDSPAYCGRVGVVGDRSGNMCMQNADVIVSLGCRWSGSVIGYNTATFCREGRIVAVDVDADELAGLREQDVKLLGNVRDLLDLPGVQLERLDPQWLPRTREWKTKWFRDCPADVSTDNPYAVLRDLAARCVDDTTFIHASGSTFNVAWHMLGLRGDQRFICSSQGDMGFELPASIGAALGGSGHVVAIMGDGSFHFNIQELETLRRVVGQARVVLLVLDNNGLQSIALSQRAVFGETFGSDPVSGFSLPDLRAITEAYSNVEFQEHVPNVSVFEGMRSGQVRVVRARCSPQNRCPKLAVTYDKHKHPTALPLEDMDPLLPWDEFAANMFVAPLARS